MRSTNTAAGGSAHRDADHGVPVGHHDRLESGHPQMAAGGLGQRLSGLYHERRGTNQADLLRDDVVRGPPCPTGSLIGGWRPRLKCSRAGYPARRCSRFWSMKSTST